VVIGFAVTRDGIPVRCWVWPGNTVDVKLVDEVKRDLNAWKLGRVVMVMDTGFNSEANRRTLQGAGDAYILGERMRLGPSGSLPEALKRPGRYKVLDSGLRIKQVTINEGSVAARRFIVVHNPEQAEREGLASMLFAGIIYQGRPIGVLQVGTAERRSFSRFQRDLLQAMAQLVAAAIENARLDRSRRETERVQRQLRLAADVQRRMLPRHLPEIDPLHVAARYVPSFELSGDFYDFLSLDGHLGVAIGDVAGKGVAASLLMASVRSSLRAYAQDLYDIDQIMARVNAALTRDTLDNEFATLFYGVIDPVAMRLTCCNAGHEPPLLLRGDEVIHLDIGGMIVGVDAGQEYERAVVDLEPGDLLLLYTDGLIDARNDAGEAFGRKRA
jgi:hypothetical protein